MNRRAWLILFFVCVIALFVSFALPSSMGETPAMIGGIAMIVGLSALIVFIVSGIKVKHKPKVDPALSAALSAQAKRAPAPAPAPAPASVPTTHSPTPSRSVQPSKPFIPPQEHHGAFLGYSYDDVQLDTSSSNLTAIQRIPPNTVLSFKRYDDERRIELYSGDILIGSMFDNKLCSMAFDFLRDPDRSAMAVLLCPDPVTIGLYFYNSWDTFVRKIEKNPNAKTFKLVSNGNSAMQEAIADCNEGSLVDITFDYDKDKYLVSSGPDDIGYMPAGFKRYIEEHENVEGRIYEIEEPLDDDEKYTVSIIVIPEKE